MPEHNQVGQYTTTAHHAAHHEAHHAAHHEAHHAAHHTAAATVRGQQSCLRSAVAI